MEVIASLILIFLALRVSISLVNLFSYNHLSDKKPENFQKVSLLIPVRNEEAVIGRLLDCLQQIDYPDFEIIVCNDHSSDRTDEILNWFAGENTSIKWFTGNKLPENWLGKNYACFQLAQKAVGQYLIFLDADVELSKDAVSKAVAFFEKKKLTLLSVFPQQKMESFAERIIVPVMNWILQSLLPMALVRTSKFQSLAAANGQFMMFDAENYRTFQWHEKVKDQNVEDIRLARLIKSKNFKIAVLLGNKDIYCRMYQRFDEALLGFSRNIHQYFSGNYLLMIAYWVIVFFGPVLVYIGLGWDFLLLFAILVFLNKLFVALAARQHAGWLILLHPIHVISFSTIVFYHIFRKIKKNTEWKGRTIKF